jgi:hypothetical protein
MMVATTSPTPPGASTGDEEATADGSEGIAGGRAKRRSGAVDYVKATFPMESKTTAPTRMIPYARGIALIFAAVTRIDWRYSRYAATDRCPKGATIPSG